MCKLLKYKLDIDKDNRLNINKYINNFKVLWVYLDDTIFIIKVKIGKFIYERFELFFLP